MKLHIRALALALMVSVAAAPFAQAADNTTGKDASGATISLRCKDTGAGVLACTSTIANSAGTIIDPAQDASVTQLHTDIGSLSAAVATAANQVIANTKLDTLHTDLGSVATAANQTTAQTSFTAIAAAVANIVAPYAATPTFTITRPANTTAYAINQTYADSTTAPTTGGFTLTNACGKSGGSGRLVSLTIVNSNDPATTMQGEVWIFSTAVTAVNDGSAFTLSDSDALNLITKIPFALETSMGGSGNNSIFTANGLDAGFTCSGSANLRVLVKVKNVYTPASAETLTVKAYVKADN